jgi:hypothetical protein
MSKRKIAQDPGPRKTVELATQQESAEESSPPTHQSIANEILVLRRKLPDAVRLYRQAVQTPFRSRMPDHADAHAAESLMFAIAMALWGERSWDDIRNAHAAMRAMPGIQERNALALERCQETLVAWRKLPRRRPRGETELERARRLAFVRREERWLTQALTLALRELGFRLGGGVGAILASVAKRSNGSAVALASSLLEISEDAFRTAKRKKRQPGS